MYFYAISIPGKTKDLPPLEKQAVLEVLHTAALVVSQINGMEMAMLDGPPVLHFADPQATYQTVVDALRFAMSTHHNPELCQVLSSRNTGNIEIQVEAITGFDALMIVSHRLPPYMEL